MEIELALLIWVLFSAGFYMMLRRSMVKLLIGLVLISQATNLLIFLAAGLTRGRPPLVPEGTLVPPPPYADPVPQALILTAIVISFGVTAFAMVLFQNVYFKVKSDDLDEMRSTDA